MFMADSADSYKQNVVHPGNPGPIIYATGRPDTLDRMGRLSAKEKLVPKPFVPSDLVAMVRQLLPAH
jgi:DNA-binding response OmpR family regulator